jgi:zinc protease
MNLRPLFLTLGVLMAAYPATAETLKPQEAAPPPIPMMAPNAVEFSLENGLDVVVIPDHRAPVVTHMVWYRVGSADEKPGESGIAHFLEHLMFQGTDTVAPNAFSTIISRNGGQDNAFTSYDYTAYYQRVARELLPMVMELEADRMVNLKLSDEELLPERDVVIEERRMRTDNNPTSRLSEQMDAAFYLSHPYGSPIIGWRHDIEALNQAQARAFYDKYYAPNNAILVVAGDVTLEEVRALAETHYGALQANPAIGARTRPLEPPHEAAIRVEMTDPRVSSARFYRQYLSPGYHTAEAGEAPALDVLGQLLGGGTTSRLYRGLVIERQLATSAGAWYSGDSLDSGVFGLYGSPAPDVETQAFELALDDIVADLLKNGVSDEEVADAKNSLIADTIYAIDNQASLARIFGAGLASGQTVDSIQAWPEQIEAVTRDEVEAVARRYLRIELSVTGVLEPQAAQIQ